MITPDPVAPPATMGQRIGRWWWVVLVAVAVTAVGLLTASDGTTTTDLHPRNPGPNGTMAAVEILQRQGIEVITVTTWPDALAVLDSRSTLLLANPQHLSDAHLRQLAEVDADVVIAGNPYIALGPLTDAVTTSPLGTPSPVAARCDDPDAVAAHRISASIGGVSPARPGVTLCFPTAEDTGVYAVWEQSGHTWRYLAAPALMTNALLADDGNAALTVRALGHHERLVWFLPSRVSAGVAPLPPLFAPLGLLAGGVALTLAVWRGRRLGRVVIEPLPVAVPPAEAILGRAHLYRRARATAHAGAALRAGTARRLARHLGLPRSAGPDALVPAVAAAAGWLPDAVAGLLYHRFPSSDAELVALSTALRTLEREVHRNDH